MKRFLIIEHTDDGPTMFAYSEREVSTRIDMADTLPKIYSVKYLNDNGELLDVTLGEKTPISHTLFFGVSDMLVDDLKDGHKVVGQVRFSDH